MKVVKKYKRISIALLALFSFSACNSSEKSTTSSTIEKEEHHLLIAAAASLETVMEKQIIPAFKEAHANVTIKGNYDSSGKLQTQIEKGLEADLFFSAATKQMDDLVSQDLIDKNSVVPLLQNKLVMIIPAMSKEHWNDFSDLKKAKTIAIGDPTSVPAGQYAEKGLKALGEWEYVEEHASLGSNVTEVLNWVAEGSAQVGLVYETDAKTNNKVKSVATLPEATLNEPIIYPVGLVTTSKERKTATEFITFLQSKQVANYFEESGFTMNK